ncbi:orotate phosphoribosyltransferase [Serendipita sp. 401]|nr:orotate phosphoribosyltransferase [Serendipita sp. 397]KAG8825418.1 orotate phosphoribosyltransferase [Serendipita sp. 401]KAG8845790.1 orotate phosphoribosyltransferase [Serendipita sp. 405]KAG9021292.1 orotate phosphoribosyltransferase [Serendipita sp. 407]
MTSLDHKQTFLSVCHAHQILQFGSFKVKSGRISPYFFNAGSFNTSSLLSSLGTAYAQAIADACTTPTTTTNSPDGSPLEFDVIFGPAYKGIPLCAITAIKLADLDPSKFGSKEWCFNRKEIKDHGEGGMLVGASSLQGKRVLVIDDVITDGAAKREAVEIIRACGGVLAGIVVAVDRQETTGKEENGRLSALGVFRKEYQVPMLAIVTLKDIIEYSKARLSEEELQAMKAYQEKYGSDEAL